MTVEELAKPVVPTGDLVVGTILPYAGLIDPYQLEEQGWLYCDGRPLYIASYSDLYAVIGTLHGGSSQTFNLPDYRGYLLRGVDGGTGRDPGAGSRTVANPGGVAGDNVGSVQSYAAALPTSTAITMLPAGAHTHSVNIPTDPSSSAVAGSYRCIWSVEEKQTGPGGAHTHIVTGGDAETRPVNAYLNFLIRFKV